LHDFADQLPGGVTVAPGETGSFEVFLNRKKVFSKKAVDRFPEPNEVEDKIGEMLGA
jgi:selT/selW/selH-like putative selenoprotein